MHIEGESDGSTLASRYFAHTIQIDGNAQMHLVSPRRAIASLKAIKAMCTHNVACLLPCLARMHCTNRYAKVKMVRRYGVRCGGSQGCWMTVSNAKTNMS